MIGCFKWTYLYVTKQDEHNLPINTKNFCLVLGRILKKIVNIRVVPSLVKSLNMSNLILSIYAYVTMNIFKNPFRDVFLSKGSYFCFSRKILFLWIYKRPQYWQHISRRTKSMYCFHKYHSSWSQSESMQSSYSSILHVSDSNIFYFQRLSSIPKLSQVH